MGRYLEETNMTEWMTNETQRLKTNNIFTFDVENLNIYAADYSWKNRKVQEEQRIYM